ncbi:DNA-directed RNA polymerases I and III subunit RPAC2-like isoform X1 [Sceloporus undulatus]|uniref:DNA-directed RNA polymerases I and III subunit RPAC2-like isoform X1 n=1 Tax=Sceloporus undulatus TaxID=8520 RepID=UPI001C4DC5AC|nr:DNA-directed RNA polymerases I and III subunit RPAC2-like isoform X1 [Sceloporus undulatus]
MAESEERAAEEEAAKKRRPRALQLVRTEGSDKSCVTFVLHDEDHTLGNSLRYMIMKDPEVEFCGYSITHPSESKINFRIQTKDGVPAVEMFQKGLEELMGVCQHVLTTFEASVEEYKAQKDINME